MLPVIAARSTQHPTPMLFPVGSPYYFFGLSTTRPHRRRPGHQTLAGKLPSWVWRLKGAPVSLVPFF